MIKAPLSFNKKIWIAHQYWITQTIISRIINNQIINVHQCLILDHKVFKSVNLEIYLILRK